MDGDSSGFGSYFSSHRRHNLAEGAAPSSTSGKGIFSASIDANPFAIPHAVSASASLAPAPSAAQTEPVKRKRGRPRKYGALPSSASLSLPSSAAAKASPSLLASSPDSSFRKKEASSSNSSTRKSQLAALGCAGQGFTPHVISISDGEDVVGKFTSVIRQGKLAVSILSATGSILNPSLRHPAAPGANITYEGKFEIVSLSGSIIYTEAGGVFSRTGGLGICLCSEDGGIIGGSVEGPLIAAGSVQVVAGSFLIDTDVDYNASTKVDDHAKKLPSPVAARATLFSDINDGPRTMTFRGSDDHRSTDSNYYGFLSRQVHMPLHWEGKRNSSGLSGTSQPADEQDEEDSRD